MGLSPETHRPSNVANFRAFIFSRVLLQLVYFLKSQLLVTCYYMKFQPLVVFFSKEVSSPSGWTEEIYIKRNGESGKEKLQCGVFFKEITSLGKHPATFIKVDLPPPSYPTRVISSVLAIFYTNQHQKHGHCCIQVLLRLDVTASVI